MNDENRADYHYAELDHCDHTQHLRIGTLTRILQCRLCAQTTKIPTTWHATPRHKYLHLQPAITITTKTL